MNINQIIIVISLVLTLYSWTKGWPRKLISSSLLLLVFLIFGSTPVDKVLSFPYSPSFLVIVLSFVFSQGIINTGLTEKILEPSLAKYSVNRYKFLIYSCLMIFVLSWIIPQPFSRAVLIGLVYKKFFDEISLADRAKEALLFGLFAFSAIINTFFLEIDIILNRALITISGVDISSLEWMKLFFLPGLIVLFMVLAAYLVLFKEELSLLEQAPTKKINTSLDREDWINLGLIILTVALWISEGLHGIDGAVFVALGILAMLFRGVLSLEDYKSINLELLMFLTASFSIGNVMMGSGIAGSLFGRFSSVVPQVYSLKFVLLVSLTTMFFHLILGSSVTTMSVVIPSLFSVVLGVDTTVIIAIIFISLYMQYILPIHNALITVGLGNGFFGSTIVTKFGLVTSLLTFVSIFIIYLTWWRFIGFL